MTVTNLLLLGLVLGVSLGLSAVSRLLTDIKSLVADIQVRLESRVPGDVSDLVEEIVQRDTSELDE